MQIQYSLLMICLFFIFGVAVSSANTDMHPLSVHDMLAMDRISSPKVCPDNKMIVFALRKTDLEQNKGITNLWLVNVDGTGLKQLTTHSSSSTNPCWAPDGKSIYFLSSRSGSSQVWQIWLHGGEAIQITDLPLDVGYLIVSPTGKHLGITVEVFPGSDIKATKQKLDEIEKRKFSGIVFDKIFIRHWDTWKDGRRSHLFVYSLEDGSVIDVMKNMNADTPSKPFGGTEEITFTPDGKAVVFSAKDAGSKEAWSTNFDLYLSPIEGTNAPQNLTDENKAWDTNPVFSPDGRTLAYFAMKKPGYEADRFRIIVRDWESGKQRVVTENWDRSPSELCWHPNGKTIYATASNIGQKALFAIDVKTGEVKTVINHGKVVSPSFAKDRIIFGLTTLKSPVELFSMKADGKDIQSITQINAEKLAHVKMGDYEQFSFKGWNDETVYCYIVKPIDFDPDKKYPVAFLIHGGPQGSFGNDFHYRWNPQAYAGAGYAAVMVDFHGSTGYGQAFTDAIQGDWGGKPYEDLQKGLTAALKRYPWMDSDRVGALGASFGGYMVNWIAGNWADRFRCLVCHDGNLDERMAYFDTEELWFPEWDHEGTPWTNPEGYEKHNPVNFVNNWKTPMLVIHGALDYRVVETQGFGTFNTLQRLGIPSKLLYFPDENHWVLKPHNSILWHNTVIDWLDQWLKI